MTVQFEETHMQKVVTTVIDRARNTTYRIRAYRRLREQEIHLAIATWKRAAKSRKMEVNSDIVIMSNIGLFDRH